jgi:CRISPR-associated exonuclease Cas4
MAGENLVNIGDLRQWAYCPRVVFYHRFYAGAGAATAKMKIGLEAQGDIEGLEARRTLKKYGMEAAERVFNPWLADVSLGLQGRPDLVLHGAERVSIVDFKLTGDDVGENHRLQLGGYSLLAEAAYGLPAEMAFIYRLSDDAVLPVEIDSDLRRRVSDAASAIRLMAESEELPQATEVRKKCEDCEYANYCADVW